MPWGWFGFRLSRIGLTWVSFWRVIKKNEIGAYVLENRRITAGTVQRQTATRQWNLEEWFSISPNNKKAL